MISDSALRKLIPVATGVIDYFPDALVDIARLSRIGNDKHNPGQPLHWNRPLSDDHPDTLMRHFIERGTVDTDGVRHSTKVAWRALAILQLELEAAERKRKEGGTYTRAEFEAVMWGVDDGRVVTLQAHDDLHNDHWTGHDYLETQDNRK